MVTNIAIPVIILAGTDNNAVANNLSPCIPTIIPSIK